MPAHMDITGPDLTGNNYFAIIGQSVNGFQPARQTLAARNP